MGRARIGLFRWLAILIFMAIPLDSITAATPLTFLEIANGLTQPLFLASPPGDTARQFVVERTGAIKIIKNGVLLQAPFLNIDNLIAMSSPDQGLMGLAFHPNYASNLTFFISYTDRSGATVLARYFRSPTNADLADPASGKILLVQPQPAVHLKGGMIAFNPHNGFLYMSFGDGGPAIDNLHYAQKPDSRLGKIVRFAFQGDTLAVPESNPYVKNPRYLPEIWATGLRSPWRWSFDRATGDLYIGDIGQEKWEELNIQPFSMSGRSNYGWPYKEGNHYDQMLWGIDSLAGLSDPAYEYDHSMGMCAITGGYVYRGCGIPDLQGIYFFADYCTGQIFTLEYTDGAVASVSSRSLELGLGQAVRPISFGEDASGELYILDYRGYVYKIMPGGISSACTSCCTGIRGNIDGDPLDLVDVSDLSLLIDHFFSYYPLTGCPEEYDVDASNDGVVDFSDLTAVIDFLFFGGDVPSCGTVANSVATR